MLLQTTGHLWTKEEVKATTDLQREFKENPCMMDALESDVNNAIDVIRKAERGEKIAYATLRNRRQRCV